MPVYLDDKKKTYYVKMSYIDKTGQRKYITKRGFNKRKDAKKYEDELLIEIEENDSVDQRITFERVADEYLAWYKQKNKQSSYTAAYNHITNHLKPYFYKQDIHSITAKDIEKFHSVKKKEVSEKTGKPYSNDYLDKMHTFLTSLLRYAQKHYQLKENVASINGSFGLRKKKRLDYWQLDEFRQYINVVDDARAYTFFMLLYYTGARKGELRALTWNDVASDKSYIRIDKTNYKGDVTEPKTAAGVRDIYLPDNCIKALNEYEDYYKEHHHFKKDYVLFGEFYRSISDSTVDRWYEKYYDLCNLNHRITIHEFRHSHASFLINIGADPKIIAERLGHEDVTEVWNRYGHLYPTTQRKLVESMNTSIEAGGQSGVNEGSEN